MTRVEHLAEGVTLMLGDMRALSADLPQASFDLILADCPYGETSLEWDRWVDGWPAIVRPLLKSTGSMWVFGISPPPRHAPTATPANSRSQQRSRTMCTVSMVGDHYADKFRPLFPPHWPSQPYLPNFPGAQPMVPVSRQEFDKLKAEVEDMKALLARAKAYDERNNEPECEIEEKMDLLRKVAKLVGVDLDDVIGKPKAAP